MAIGSALSLAVSHRNVLFALATVAAVLAGPAGAFAQTDIMAMDAMPIDESVPMETDVFPMDDELPFSETVSGEMGGNIDLWDAHFRFGYQTAAYGQENGQLSLGFESFRPLASGNGVMFLKGQFDFAPNSFGNGGVNVGGGFRWLYPSILGNGQARIFGISAWYDGDVTVADNYFNQVGVSLESLGELWDVRVNANMAVGETWQMGHDITYTNELGYIGNSIGTAVWRPADQAMSVVDFEVARAVLDHNAWIFGGGYSLHDDDQGDFGYKVGARGYVNENFLVELRVSDDDTFGTTVTFGAVWYPGRLPVFGQQQCGIERRLREPVIRNEYIVTRQEDVRGYEMLTDQDNEPLRVVHVDSNASGTGDGTYESPFTSLDGVFDGSQEGDLILVHAGSTYSGQAITLRDQQRLLGEGDNQMHTVMTYQMGEINLPETSSGSWEGAVPVISNASGTAAVTLANVATTRSEDDETSYNEVSNFAINGGTNGIVSAASGIADADLNHLTISNTTEDGIRLTALVETIEEDNSEQVRFNPIIDEVTFSNIGGDGIDLTGSSEPSTTPVTEDIQLSNITVTGGSGYGVRITSNNSQATISDYTYDGQTTALGGLMFSESDGGATASDLTFSNGATGTGTGINIDSSDGTFTFTDTTLTNTGGASLRINGGEADVTFTGLITQGNNAAAVHILGEHTGTVNFNEVETDDGVITATAGTGLVFDQADGTYNFNHAVALSGGARISINDSDGTFTFSDTTITDPTGIAFELVGGEADVTFTGSITQNTNDVAAVSISGGHSGTVNFNESETDAGVITATTGAGLVFSEADGTYNFNHAVALSGGARIDINDSDGTLKFSDTTITSPDAIAFTVVGGEADVTFTGNITQANNFAALSVTGGHTGTLNFNAGTDFDNVIEATAGAGLVFNQADGTYNFNDPIELSGGAAIDIENSDGTFNFADDSTITSTSGTAFHVANSSATVTYSGTISNSGGRSVLIESNDGGTVTFGGTITDSAEGILVQNNTGGTFRFNGSTDLDTTTNDAVTITDNDDDVTVSFANLDINTTSGNGLVATNGGIVEVTGSSNTITTTTGVAINMNDVAIGSSNGMNFESISVDGAANGIVLTDVTGGTFTVGSGGSNPGDGGVIQNTTGAGIVLTNTASVSLNNMRIVNTAGNGVTLVHDNATAFNVTLADSIVRNTGAQGIDLNASGSGVLRLTLNDNAVDSTATEGIHLDFADGVNTANVTLDGNVVANDTDNEAVLITADGASAKTLNLLMENNRISNDSTNAAASIQGNGTVAINATVHDNTFNNASTSTGRAFATTANAAGASVRLSLLDNTASKGAGNSEDEYHLHQINGTFSVEKKTTPAVPAEEVPELTAAERNGGTIEYDGTITTDAGNIPTP